MLDQTTPYAQLRRTILLDLLKSVTWKNPDSKDLENFLTIDSLGCCFDDELLSEEHNHDHDDIGSLPGGLSHADVRRWYAPVQNLDKLTQRRVCEGMNKLVLAILDYLDGSSEDPSVDEEGRFECAWKLPDTLESLLASNTQVEAELTELRVRIQSLVHSIVELHPQLEHKLTDALTTLPPLISVKQKASIDLQATAVELQLLRLSLLRVRAHKDLYHSDMQPSSSSSKRIGSKAGLTTAAALMAAHETLTAECTRMERENEEAKTKLHEYDRLLALVDNDGGYRQIIDDWGQVQRDIDECRKDLRRLGWTGD